MTLKYARWEYISCTSREGYRSLFLWRQTMNMARKTGMIWKENLQDARGKGNGSVGTAKIDFFEWIHEKGKDNIGVVCGTQRLYIPYMRIYAEKSFYIKSKSDYIYHFPIGLKPKETSVWFQANRKMVNTIWLWCDLKRFQKNISVRTVIIDYLGISQYTHLNGQKALAKFKMFTFPNVYLNFRVPCDMAY